MGLQYNYAASQATACSFDLVCSGIAPRPL